MLNTCKQKLQICWIKKPNQTKANLTFCLSWPSLSAETKQQAPWAGVSLVWGALNGTGLCASAQLSFNNHAGLWGPQHPMQKARRHKGAGPTTGCPWCASSRCVVSSPHPRGRRNTGDGGHSCSKCNTLSLDKSTWHFGFSLLPIEI